jgi:hypothetical protein
MISTPASARVHAPAIDYVGLLVVANLDQPDLVLPWIEASRLEVERDDGRALDHTDSAL